MPRLTAEQWTEVRARREAGESFPSLANAFGISHQAIQKRAKDEGWTAPSKSQAINLVNALELERRRFERERQKKKDALIRKKNNELKSVATETAKFERAVQQGGLVYIVYCEHLGIRWHKIGVAKDFTARLAVIQSGCPLPIYPVMFGQVKAARYFEKKMHAKFEKSRVSGEWFSLSDAQVFQAINMLSKEIEKSATIDMDLVCQD